MEPAVGRTGFSKLISTVPFLLILILSQSVSTAYAQQLPDNAIFSTQQNDDSFHRTWQLGGFAMGGWPPYYETRSPLLRYYEEIQFYSAGLEAGRMLTAIHGSSFLRGRGEAVMEVLPYWQEHAPTQLNNIYLSSDGNTPAFIAGFPAYNQHGVSITPFLFRWNFMKQDKSRLVPWVQLGSGVLWTSQRFPQGYGVNNPQGETSRFNFTPQVDFGESIFVRKNQSLDLGVRAIHYTSFGLGEYDPGISIAVEFTAGYSWWK